MLKDFYQLTHLNINGLRYVTYYHRPSAYNVPIWKDANKCPHMHPDVAWVLIGHQPQYPASHWLKSPVRSGHQWNVEKPVTLPPVQTL